MSAMKSFANFTNQYSLSKTLRFELIPEPRTDELLKKEKVFMKDADIKKKYEATKPYIDRLHKEFVERSLARIEFSSLDKYLLLYEKWKNDKSSGDKEMRKAEEDLRKNVREHFDLTASEWAKTYKELKMKNVDIELLFEEAVFKLLKKKYGTDPDSVISSSETGEKISIFDSWKGFTGYFGKFFETRKNLYDIKGNAGAIPTRIVDQNLRRFCDNILLYQTLKERMSFKKAESLQSKDVDEIFNMDYYRHCILQSGIKTYNDILGGWIEDNGAKIQGLNEVINLHRQKTGEKLPFFKPLDRQILSDKEIFINEIQDNTQFQQVMKMFIHASEEKVHIVSNLFDDFVHNPDKYDLSKIYLRSEAVNTISYKWTDETLLFKEALYQTLKQQPDKVRQAKQVEEDYKLPDFIALSDINNALKHINSDHFWKQRYYEASLFSEESDTWKEFLQIFYFEFQSLLKSTVTDDEGRTNEIGYLVVHPKLQKMMTEYSPERSLTPEEKALVKDFADSVLRIYQMSQYFAVEKKRNWLPEYELDMFYTDSSSGFLNYYDQAFQQIVQVYNLLRNYLTKKPYSDEKWKLNFENPTLADGWDKNKESDNTAVILRKGDDYFLGIMKKGHTKIFDDRYKHEWSTDSVDGYTKMVYKYFPDQSKMFPKVCFSKKGRDYFQPSDEIVRIYENNEFKKGGTFSLSSMQKLIDFYKDCLTKYEGWQCYSFNNLKPTEEYVDNIGEFYHDVAIDGYVISFEPINTKYLDSKMGMGELYLFQIKNKDWSTKSNGSKNLHTLYFESIFSDANRAELFPIKLNGQAELFFRPKSIQKSLQKRNFPRGIVEKKRYTEDKCFLHLPITINRSPNLKGKFNEQINSYLNQNKDINILGIDRGEKHLAYFTVINQKGEILESGSLNKLNNKDYYSLLKQRAVDREKARKDWQSVEQIKDLKKGYISQVVKVIADLAIKHNAIIVLEDLNMRFKQIRGGIEKSVYQQLEKALIDKLGYLVMKDQKDPAKAGHVLNGYQLAAPFESFQKMGKQTGIIFYTQAAYTSRIDPLTGWRPNLYLKYKNAKQAQEDLARFEKIEFNQGAFEFTYDLKQFSDVQRNVPRKTQWTVSSDVERFYWSRKENNNKGGYIHYKTGDITTKLIDLFESVAIDYKKDIIPQIRNLDTKAKENVAFFKNFMFYFKLICQIRNTQQDKEGNENDFIFSPVAPYFDSRKSDGKLPVNGDENGAYNIARKGIIILRKITKESSWKDLYVSNQEWDNFAQNTS